MTPAELKQVRELYGATQGEFAKLVGLDGAYAERTVRRYESGATKIIGPVARCVELLREAKQGINNRSSKEQKA